MLIKKFKSWIHIFIKKENENVIFERVTKANYWNGLIFDGVFFLLFIIAPLILASLSEFPKIPNTPTLYIVNFSLLLVIYSCGILIYWKHDHVGLIRNGGIGFFIALIVMNLLIPIIRLIIDQSIVDSNLVLKAQVLLTDLAKVIIIIVLMKISFPLLLDIKQMILHKLIVLLVVTTITVGLFFAINPLFSLLNQTLNSHSVLPNHLVKNDYYKGNFFIIPDVGNYNKNFIANIILKGDFFSYWTIIFIALITPLFYELVFRYSIMVLMKTNIMKFTVPALYFIVILLINNKNVQDMTHFFYYLWWSIILTTVLFIKKNIVVSALSSNFISVINLLKITI